MKFSILAVALGASAPAIATALPHADSLAVLGARKSGPAGTNFSVGKKRISVGEVTDGATQKYAGAYKCLWDNVQKQCDDTQCGQDSSATTSYCVAAAGVAGDDSCSSDEGGENICVSAVGSFPGKSERETFFKIAKQVFYDSITRKTQSSAVYDDLATDFIHIVTTKDAPVGSGFELTLNFKLKESEDWGQCPAFISQLAQGGSLAAPEFSEVFGAIQLLCSVNNDG